MHSDPEVLPNKCLSFVFNTPKIENEGEDADPVLISHNNSYFLSVCDGMGGSGSETYEINGERKSGAFISSRVVNEIAADFFSSLLESGKLIDETELAKFKSLLITGLTKKLSELKKEGDPRLKSKLLKDLPTTFAAMTIRINNDAIHIVNLWAGDSRTYSLTPEFGLQQLTADDLKLKYDPFDNLTKDSPLDNVISADGAFEIRSSATQMLSPCILFAVTDGCYGYFNTPMQFEFSLLKSMSEALNEEDWKEKLMALIKEVSGDDYSMALLAIGFKDFEEIKARYRERQESMYLGFIQDLNKSDQALKDLDLKKKQLENNLKAHLQQHSELQKTLWKQYQTGYLKHIETVYEKK
jgi:serine/threonine protein phosphatase PrpC